MLIGLAFKMYYLLFIQHFSVVNSAFIIKIGNVDPIHTYIIELKYIESKLYTGEFGHVGRTTRWRSRIFASIFTPMFTPCYTYIYNHAYTVPYTYVYTHF